LRPFYTDLQILELTHSLSANNSTNRWKEGAGIPQSRSSAGFRDRAENPVPTDRVLPIETYLTPTPDEYLERITTTIPLAVDDAGQVSRQAIRARPPLESREEVESALVACRSRAPRLPLVEEATAREVLGADSPAGPLPQWVLLLANFPRDGRSRIVGLQSADETGDLPPLLKAQVSWIVARQDRAWYAVGEAKRRLQDLGLSDEEIYALDGDWSGYGPAEQAQFRLARNLAASPIVLSDAEVHRAVELVGPRDVVQLITYSTGRSYFNRVTEAAGLRLQE